LYQNEIYCEYFLVFFPLGSVLILSYVYFILIWCKSIYNRVIKNSFSRQGELSIDRK